MAKFQSDNDYISQIQEFMTQIKDAYITTDFFKPDAKIYYYVEGPERGGDCNLIREQVLRLQKHGSSAVVKIRLLNEQVTSLESAKDALENIRKLLTSKEVGLENVADSVVPVTQPIVIEIPDLTDECGPPFKKLKVASGVELSFVVPFDLSAMAKLNTAAQIAPVYVATKKGAKKIAGAIIAAKVIAAQLPSADRKKAIQSMLKINGLKQINTHDR